MSDSAASPPPSPEDLKRWDREFVWHPFTQMAEYEPFIVQSARGCVLTDVDGNEYLDGVSSLWCNVHGHRHPKLDEALRRQLDQVAHVTLLGASNPTSIELARRLVELSPRGLEHVFYSDDGATAVEVALKIAFQYQRQRPDPRPEKTSFLALGDAYHGDTLGDVSVGGMDLFHRMFHPLLFPTFRAPCPTPYRLPPDVSSEEALDYYVDRAEAVLAEHHERIAAFVVEPLIQGAAGIIVHPSGYLRRIRELTRKYDVLLIADEVAVGMGRTGTLFACDQEDVSPDLLCMAKGLTGGYLPLAATLATDEIHQAFLGEFAEQKTFFHGHTYGGNPLGAAVAIATLDVFEEERTLEHLPAKEARLNEHLARIAELPHVGDVRGRGLMAGVELVRDRDSKESFPLGEKRGYRACDFAMQHGVRLRPLGDVVVIMPPLSVSMEELDRICEAVEIGIRKATET